MSYAERIHNNRTGNKRREETPEDRAYRLATRYNAILRMIEEVSDARTFVQCRNTISSFAQEAGKNSLDVIKLNEKLNSRIRSVTQEIQKNIDILNKEVEKIKSGKFTESIEVLQELNTQAEHRLLQFMMKLDSNKDGNKRKLGNFVTHADRADAIALMKLASIPQYADCFTSKQKQTILEKSKNSAEIVFERNKQPLLEEKRRELGHEYIRAMNIRNVQKQISNNENIYYFNREGND